MQIGNNDVRYFAGYAAEGSTNSPANKKNQGSAFAQTLADHERLRQGRMWAGQPQEEAADTGNTGVMTPGAVSPREMTMEEYKQYIAQKLRQLPVYPGRTQAHVFVTISEEAYAAMKNDPEYEAWVLDDLRSVWSGPGFCYGSGDEVYISVYYGATKEECHSDTWTIPGRSASDRARERQEENRRRLEKKIKKLKLQKQLREIAFQRQERQRALVKKLIQRRQETEKENRQRWKKTAVKDKPDGSRVLETTTKKKTMEKITERDILRVEEALRKLQLQQEMINQRFFEAGSFYGFQYWLLNG